VDPLVILGSGGYAQEVLWVLDDLNVDTPRWEFLGFIDPAAPTKKGQSLYERPILGGFEAAGSLPENVFFASGIGNPLARRKEALKAEELGWHAASLVHPTVTIARQVEMGPGTVVGAGSILAPYAKLGRHCSVNLHVSIGHNSVVGDYCVLAPGARLSGFANLGEGVFVGTNASIHQGQRIGSFSTLGANSILVTDLGSNKSSLGVPARSFTPFGRSKSSSREKPS
jgi:sugar O-acyltransferase (sialic acid O-acetyltransferase NeuD family)